MVAVFATNQDTGFRDAGRALAAERWPEERCVVRSPVPFYGDMDVEEFRGIVVQPRYAEVIDSYQRAGAEVVVTTADLDLMSTEEPAPAVTTMSEPPAPRRRRKGA